MFNYSNLQLAVEGVGVELLEEDVDEGADEPLVLGAEIFDFQQFLSVEIKKNVKWILHYKLSLSSMHLICAIFLKYWDIELAIWHDMQLMNWIGQKRPLVSNNGLKPVR